MILAETKRKKMLLKKGFKKLKINTVVPYFKYRNKKGHIIQLENCCVKM